METVAISDSLCNSNSDLKSTRKFRLRYSSAQRTILAVLSLCAFAAAVWISTLPMTNLDVRAWTTMAELGLFVLCVCLALFGGEGIYEPPICKIRWLRWTLKKTTDALEREKRFVEKFNSEVTWLQARLRVLEEKQ